MDGTTCAGLMPRAKMGVAQSFMGAGQPESVVPGNLQLARSLRARRIAVKYCSDDLYV